MRFCVIFRSKQATPSHERKCYEMLCHDNSLSSSLVTTQRGSFTSPTLTPQGLNVYIPCTLTHRGAETEQKYKHTESPPHKFTGLINSRPCHNRSSFPSPTITTPPNPVSPPTMNSPYCTLAGMGAIACIRKHTSNY